MKRIKITVFTPTSSEHGFHVGEIGPINPADKDDADGQTVVVKLDPRTQLMKCLDEVTVSLGEKVRIEIVDYDDPTSVKTGMDTLNLALESAGADIIDSFDRFTIFVNSSAPLFVINNRIAFTGSVPPSFQVISRVKSALR